MAFILTMDIGKRASRCSWREGTIKVIFEFKEVKKI
jgi:hypothetical protein